LKKGIFGQLGNLVGGVIAYGDFGNYFSGDGRASFINVIFAGQRQKEGNPQ
jgi:hypothetical protein